MIVSSFVSIKITPPGENSDFYLQMTQSPQAWHCEMPMIKISDSHRRELSVTSHLITLIVETL